MQIRTPNFRPSDESHTILLICTHINTMGVGLGGGGGGGGGGWGQTSRPVGKVLHHEL